MIIDKSICMRVSLTLKYYKSNLKVNLVENKNYIYTVYHCVKINLAQYHDSTYFFLFK